MPTYVIGDLHGHFNDYRRLLAAAHLIDKNNDWCGGTNHLWLIGDFFDRGIHGVACVDLTMKLQRQARAVGGDVGALLGNHEMMILCAHRFRNAMTSIGNTVLDQWRQWGGIEKDLAGLTDSHVNWLNDLPMMHRLDDVLLIHSDATFYVGYGRTIDQVNEHIRNLLKSTQLGQWETALRSFAERRAFSALGVTGQQRAEQMLKYFDARQLVHGHTPIPLATGEAPELVVSAWTYAGGRCVNVDGGIYMGGPGFVHTLT